MNTELLIEVSIQYYTSPVSFTSFPPRRYFLIIIAFKYTIFLLYIYTYAAVDVKVKEDYIERIADILAVWPARLVYFVRRYMTNRGKIIKYGRPVISRSRRNA